MATDDVAQLLRRHRLRVTPQRRAILQAFRTGRDEHLSADEVMSRASAAVPEIGRGTVYATLAELSELGLLASVGSAEPVRYETNLAAHDHFHCRLCLRLFDVDLGGSDVCDRPLPGYTTESVAVRAQGICAQCHDYERGLRDGAAAILRSPLLAAEAMDGLSCLRIDSPVGELALVASAEGIVRIAFSDHADFELLADHARARRGPAAGRPRLQDLDATIGRYFDGERTPPTDLIDWRLAPGDTSALIAVQRIAFAESRSYDAVCGDVSAYDCGRLMGGNPLALLIPCHRVTCGNRWTEDYVGGFERLGILRELEAR